MIDYHECYNGNVIPMIVMITYDESESILVITMMKLSFCDAHESDDIHVRHVMNANIFLDTYN